MSAPQDRRIRRAVEDSVRGFPFGAPTMVIVDKLVRAGLDETEALRSLDTLRDAGALELEAGRWRLPVAG